MTPVTLSRIRSEVSKRCGSNSFIAIISASSSRSRSSITACSRASISSRFTSSSVDALISTQPVIAKPNTNAMRNSNWKNQSAHDHEQPCLGGDRDDNVGDPGCDDRKPKDDARCIEYCEGVHSIT